MVEKSSPTDEMGRGEGRKDRNGIILCKSTEERRKKKESFWMVEKSSPSDEGGKGRCC